MAETPVPAPLNEAIKALWRIPPPGPVNLLSSAQFIRLRDACESLYSKAQWKDGLSFALSNALRVLGLPSGLALANTGLALPAEVAAGRLDAAFRKTQASRLFLCPLDNADDLPELKFGPNRIQKFTADQLETLVDPARLRRIHPNWIFDAERFSQFTWLVVEETYHLDQEPGARAAPFFYMPIGRLDWGGIEPHRSRFDAAVEAALFAILLAPWEDWVHMPENCWPGFQVPWVYTLQEDIFVPSTPPPSPDTLSWEPEILYEDGEVVIERERPRRLSFCNAVVQASDWLNDARWDDLRNTCRSSPLFETPIAHFLVRAFLAEPLDEFLAHITTIEAALGLQSDYRKGGATRRMSARVSALLGVEAAGDHYCTLFELRSTFLHGRKMNDIPGEQRLIARRLARRVVNALVEAALASPGLQSREAYLLRLTTR